MAKSNKNQMDVVSHGLLEDITKAPSVRRSGSVASLKSDAGGKNAPPRDIRPALPNGGSLEFLSPEEILRQEFDLALEECHSDEDTSDDDGWGNDTGRTSEIFGIAEPLTDRQKQRLAQQQLQLQQQEQDRQDEEDFVASQQLSLMYSDAEEDDIDSEEENEITRKIRAEITAQVREEMKDELQVYADARAKVTADTPAQEEEVEEMDPKLKQAILQMRKYDRILAKKIKKEKRVKRDRIILTNKLHAELKTIKREDGSRETADVKTNTMKFLALTLPPSHNSVDNDMAIEQSSASGDGASPSRLGAIADQEEGFHGDDEEPELLAIAYYSPTEEEGKDVGDGSSCGSALPVPSSTSNPPGSDDISPAYQNHDAATGESDIQGDDGEPELLAITYSPAADDRCDDKEGVKVEETEYDDAASETPITPVFQTQVMEETLERERERQQERQKSGHSGISGGGESVMSASQSSIKSQSSTSTSLKSADGRRSKKDKDFIKRNIQLAADAGNTIAMTDDEKQRVENLLGDLEALPDIPEEGDHNLTFESENPYQIVLSAGEGYFPEREDKSRMDTIDGHLKALLPPEDFQAIASTPQNYTPQPVTLFTRTMVDTDEDLDQLGEKALKETKEQRDMKTRLNEIELELNNLSSAVELEIKSPTLTNDQLDMLLDQCARTMSRATSETDSCAKMQSSRSVSSRQDLLENPPQLSKDVLQQLLADARSEMASGRTSAYTNDDLDTNNVPVEPITRDAIRELLRDSRATSRATSRAVSRASEFETGPESVYASSERFTPPDDDDPDVSKNKINPASWFAPKPQQSNPPFQRSDLPPALLKAQSGMFDSEEFEDRQPFLPSIDPKGMLSTQQQGGIQSKNASHDTSIWPSLSGRSSRSSLQSFVGDSLQYNGSLDRPPEGAPTPHPPSSAPRTGSGGRQRAVTQPKPV